MTLEEKTTLKSKKKKLLLITFTFILLIFPMSLVIGYDSDFNNFKGSSHYGGGGGCHDYVNPESPTGYIALNSSPRERVLPGESFLIALQIVQFSEAASEDVSVGFPSGTPGRGDNKEFSFNITQYDGVSLDTEGNSAILWFNVTAPLEKGVYTLVADALEANYGVGNMDWATGSMTIIVWLEGPDPVANEIILYIVIAIGLVAAVVALLMIKKRY